ncbi:MAG: hypothetical protein WAN47_10585 [Nitrosotalea sp.]
MEKNFYSEKISTAEKKIFILGSSHVMPLNTTTIQEYLLEANQNYTIYNLAVGSDHPIERLDTINMIISEHPTIVIYGVADRDFVSLNPATDSSLNTPTSILPDPHEFFAGIFSELMSPLQYDLDFLQSPKILTLSSIQDIFLTHNLEEKLQGPHYPNSPFFSIGKGDTITASKNELENQEASINQVQFNQVASQFREIPPPDKNENFIALEEIITKLHQNNIKVIVFTTPQNEIYLDAMPAQYRKSFDVIVNRLADNHDIEFYSLFDKYENLNVWHDLNHIAFNDNDTMYCKDVTKMIEAETYP